MPTLARLTGAQVENSVMVTTGQQGSPIAPFDAAGLDLDYTNNLESSFLHRWFDHVSTVMTEAGYNLNNLNPTDFRNANRQMALMIRWDLLDEARRIRQHKGDKCEPLQVHKQKRKSFVKSICEGWQNFDPEISDPQFCFDNRDLFTFEQVNTCQNGHDSLIDIHHNH